MTTPEIPQRIRELAEKWLQGTITPSELAEFNTWYDQFDDEKLELPSHAHYARSAIEQRILGAIRQKAGLEVPLNPIGKRKWLYRGAVAAAILIAVSFAGYFLINTFDKKKSNDQHIAVMPTSTDIRPGGDKATLTLDDGSTILLDSAKNGRLADQGNTTILKVSEGQLAYAASSETSQAPTYNTVSTPRGGQFQVVLPDGSKVWLNSVSSLRFPTHFAGTDRSVELTGEAYFDVAKDATKPFRVKVNGVQVEVLGTQFNIMAYNNEANINTTLLEGAVRLSYLSNISTEQKNSENNITLQPGQQARIANPLIEKKARQGFVLINNADTDQVVAWKNGVFQLTSADVPTIMRQLERWYDVEVVYQGAVPSGTLSGKVRRDLSLSQVMRAMEISGIHSRIEGRKIIIAN